MSQKLSKWRNNQRKPKTYSRFKQPKTLSLYKGQVPSFCLHPMKPILFLSATGKQSNMPHISGACWMCISIISLVRTAMPNRVPVAIRSWRWFWTSWSQVETLGIERMEKRKWLWDEVSTDIPEEVTEVWDPFLGNSDMLKEFDDVLRWNCV